MISPKIFIYNELVIGTTAKDFEDLSTWLLSNNIENAVILDVASNGLDYFTSEAQKSVILESADIAKLTLEEKFGILENIFIEDFRNGEITLRSLIKQLGALCVYHHQYERFGLWYALDESLDYYLENGMGTLWYELKGNPIESAQELLKTNSKL